MKFRFMCVVLAFGLFMAAPSFADDHMVTVENPWIKYNHMQKRPSAGYLTVTNNSDTAVSIVAIKAPSPARSMLHKVIEVDGVSKMVGLSNIDMAAGASAKLEPRGMHVMLYNLPNLKDETSFPLTIVLSTGEKLEVMFKVCPLTASAIC